MARSNNVSENIKYKALYDYVAKSNDELSLKEYDIVISSDKHNDSTWMKGYKESDRSQTKGIFPGNYVEEIIGDKAGKANIKSEAISIKHEGESLSSKAQLLELHAKDTKIMEKLIEYVNKLKGDTKISTYKDIILTDLKTNNLKALLYLNYRHDIRTFVNLLTILGISIECTSYNIDLSDTNKFAILKDYYRAIINVYETKFQPKERTKDTLYDFIMSYFASVCK